MNKLMAVNVTLDGDAISELQSLPMRCTAVTEWLWHLRPKAAKAKGDSLRQLLQMLRHGAETAEMLAAAYDELERSAPADSRESPVTEEKVDAAFVEWKTAGVVAPNVEAEATLAKDADEVLAVLKEREKEEGARDRRSDSFTKACLQHDWAKGSFKQRAELDAIEAALDDAGLMQAPRGLDGHRPSLNVCDRVCLLADAYKRLLASLKVPPEG